MQKVIRYLIHYSTNMSLTGIIDIDINIISFCDFDTILNLLFLEDLIEQSICTIIINSSSDDLGSFIVNLVMTNETEWAKKFIVEVEEKFENLDEYYEIIFRNVIEDIIIIYFDINCNKIINYFNNYFDECDNGEITEDSWLFLVDLVKLYRLALDYNNLEVTKFLFDYCGESFLYVWQEISYEYDDGDYYKIKDLLHQIRELNESH